MSAQSTSFFFLPYIERLTSPTLEEYTSNSLIAPSFNQSQLIEMQQTAKFSFHGVVYIMGVFYRDHEPYIDEYLSIFEKERTSILKKSKSKSKLTPKTQSLVDFLLAKCPSENN